MMIKIRTCPSSPEPSVWTVAELWCISRHRQCVITYLSATVLPEASGKWQFFHRPPGRKQEEGLSFTSVSVCHDVVFLLRPAFWLMGQPSNFPAVWLIRVCEDIIGFRRRLRFGLKLKHFTFLTEGDSLWKPGVRAHLIVVEWMIGSTLFSAALLC